MDRTSAVNDELNVPVAAQHRTKKWKMHENVSAMTGRATLQVTACHLCPSPQPQLTVLSLPDLKTKKIWSYTEKEQSVNSHPSSLESWWRKLISFNFFIPEKGTVWKILTK